MMNQPLNIEHKIINQFLDTLKELPDIHVLSKALFEPTTAKGIRHDAQLYIQIAKKAFILLIEMQSEVYPRNVREAVWRIKQPVLKEDESKDATEVVPVIIAKSIAPGAKELLRQEGISYFDSGGSLFLSAPGAYLYIEKPPPKALEKSMGLLFSERRAQVLHALLIKHKEWLGVNDLAELAKVSTATVSHVLTELDRLSWTATRGQGPHKERRLTDPSSLLDGWVKQLPSLRPSVLRRYYIPSKGSESLLARLSQVFEAKQVLYAVTDETAAQIYTPFLSHVSQVQTRLLHTPSAEAALGELNARVVNEGANLVVIEAKSECGLLFRERLDDVWLASPIQVYLDLLHGKGRAKEMAEHLRKEKIGF